jgi:hypothetical protein
VVLVHEAKFLGLVYAAWAVGTLGCRDGGAIATPAPPMVAAPLSTTLGGSPPSPSGPASVAEPQPTAPTLKLELKSEPTNDPNVWSLVATGVDSAFHYAITPFRLPAICGLVEDGAQRAKVTCADGTTVALMLNGGLQIGGEKVTLPRAHGLDHSAADPKLTLPTRIEQPPSPVCGAEPATVIDVRLRRKPLLAAGERRDSIVMELLGQSFELLSFDPAPMSCNTSLVFPKTTTLTGGCAFNESGYNFSITFSEGVLWVETGWDGYDGKGLYSRYGVRLPCGATPRFHELRLRDSGWQPFGSRCGDVCLTQSARCEDACYRRWADDFGKLSAVGSACTSRCSDATNACTSACRRKGQYP